MNIPVPISDELKAVLLQAVQYAICKKKAFVSPANDGGFKYNLKDAEAYLS